MQGFLALWLLLVASFAGASIEVPEEASTRIPKAACPRLLATAIGAAGPLTITIDDEGNLVYWYDGYVTTTTGTAPNFTRSTHRLHLGNLASLQSLAAQTSPDMPEGYLVVADTVGMLKLVTPEHKTFAINVPSSGAVTAATIFRPAAGNIQAAGGMIAGIRTGEPNGTSARGDLDRLRFIRRETQYEIYFAVGRTVYRMVMRPKELSQATEDIRAALAMGGLARVRILPPETPNGLPRQEVTASSLSLIDLDPTENTSLWLPTGDPTMAMEIQPFERVLTLRDEADIEAIHYVQVTSARRMVLANEQGKVLVIDPIDKRILHRVSFSGGAWIKSISAHEVGNQMQVWAINARGNQLWRWTSTDVATQFTLLQAQLPEGVRPMALSTAAQPVPIQARGIGAARAREGFYTALTILPGETGLVLERILVLGNDGNLYAYTSPSRGITFDPRTVNDRSWVTYPFPR